MIQLPSPRDCVSQTPRLVLPSDLGLLARLGDEEMDLVKSAPVHLASLDVGVSRGFLQSTALERLQFRFQRRQISDNRRAMSEGGEQLVCASKPSAFPLAF
jgi:hypothetical protein